MEVRSSNPTALREETVQHCREFMATRRHLGLMTNAGLSAEARQHPKAIGRAERGETIIGPRSPWAHRKRVAGSNVARQRSHGLGSHRRRFGLVSAGGELAPVLVDGGLNCLKRDEINPRQGVRLFGPDPMARYAGSLVFCAPSAASAQ